MKAFSWQSSSCARLMAWARMPSTHIKSWAQRHEDAYPELCRHTRENHGSCCSASLARQQAPDHWGLCLKVKVEYNGKRRPALTSDFQIYVDTYSFTPDTHTWTGREGKQGWQKRYQLLLSLLILHSALCGEGNGVVLRAEGIFTHKWDSRKVQAT